MSDNVADNVVSGHPCPETDGTAVFELSGASYSYPGGKPVLRDIGFVIEAGESVAILGANASGKSTLLHLLDGLYFPNAGRVKAFGTELTEDSVETAPFSRQFRQKVGFLFQNSDAQLFCATVEEELAFGPLQLRLLEAEIEQRVDDSLRMFEIERLRDRSPQSLSGGEKKRVALASIITCGPRVILLDEPSAGLDPRTQQWLTEFLGALHESGVTLVTSSHDLSFVAEVCERALILPESAPFAIGRSKGAGLVYDGPIGAALSDLDLLLSVNLIHAHAHRHDGSVHVHPHLHGAWHEHHHADGRE